MSHVRGITYGILLVIIYSFMNVYFKALADYTFNAPAFLAIAVLFAGTTLVLIGGKTHLTIEAIKSPFTWLYGAMYIVSLILILNVMKYISATDASLLMKSMIITSLILSYLIFKRNTLGKGIIGIPFIALGLGIIFYGIDKTHLNQIIFFTIAISLAQSLFYLSIEMNKTIYKTKNYMNDLSVIGYILICTSGIFLFSLFAASLINLTTPLSIAFIPKLNDFYDPAFMVHAAFYGVVCATISRYLMFKSVQTIKSEVFTCLLSFVPLMTMLSEKAFAPFGWYKDDLEITPALLLASILIIAGSIIIVVRRYIAEDITDDKEIEELRVLVMQASIFFHDDYLKTAKAMDIELTDLHDIIDKTPNYTIHKDIAAKIKQNYIKNVAKSDSLTGLANKLQFMTELKSMSPKSDFSLFYLDLNKFKPVNDTYGHATGDIILVTLAHRLANFIGERGIVTRMGGDEYCILMHNTTKKQAKTMVKKLIAIVEEPIEVDSIKDKLFVSASIGISNYPEDINNYDHLEGLIDFADKNMFRGKSKR